MSEEPAGASGRGGADRFRSRRPVSVPARPAGLFERRVIGRRQFMYGALGTAAGLAFAACASEASEPLPVNDPGGAGTPAGPEDLTPEERASFGPLPDSVPPGTQLAINDGSTAGQSQQLRLGLAGLLDDLPFEVSEWTNLRGGPEVINGFRAGSVDLATNAGIPPIQAHYMGGINARIIGVSLRRDPTYVFVTRPGSDIETAGDFRGKRLAFSEGQAQGIVMLRAVIEAGLELDDVDLVPLTSVQFVTALQAGQVDVAPVGLNSVFQYLNEYEQDGARAIQTDVVDFLNVLWAPGRVFTDEAKVAAIASYIPVWAQGNVWEYEHPETWIEEYFVNQEGLSWEQGEEIVEATPRPIFPINWDEAIEWEQETIDLMASADVVETFDAEILFDRRFERLAAEAVPEEYWT